MPATVVATLCRLVWWRENELARESVGGVYRWVRPRVDSDRMIAQRVPTEKFRLSPGMVVHASVEQLQLLHA
jgi:hypothetical protein